MDPTALGVVGAAHQARLDPAVDLLGERLDGPALLAAADAFVLSTSPKGLAISLLEAMAAGLPVVAFAVGGVPEAVDDGKASSRPTE